MNNGVIYKVVNTFIAIVWLANGFLCKVLNLVPRHEMIVERILGDSHAIFFTKVIGILETLMSIWIIIGIKSRHNVMLQITVIALMNIIEFILVPDLLLWGRLNLVFAILFILLIYYNEFKINKQLAL
ncbi:MAG: hypothetical protein JWP45_3326 [Mucilaginibacter sp.]|nr:hypothetical protein [Mucilaginibacter sp.]